jgi:hypothetical protein
LPAVSGASADDGETEMAGPGIHVVEDWIAAFAGGWAAVVTVSSPGRKGASSLVLGERSG